MVRYGKWRKPKSFGRRFAKLDHVLPVAFGTVAGFLGLACCSIGAIPAFFGAYGAIRKRITLQKLEPIRDMPPLYTQHACYLFLIYRGKTYGYDEGLVSLLEGRLVYEGRRTSFSVPAVDIADSQMGRLGLGFDFPTTAGPCSALLRPLEREEMREDHRRWIRTRVDSLDQESIVLPPARPSEEALKTLRLAERIGYGLVPMVLIGVSVTFLRFSGADAVLMGSIGLVFCFAVAIYVYPLRNALRCLDQAPELPETPN